MTQRALRLGDAHAKPNRICWDYLPADVLVGWWRRARVGVLLAPHAAADPGNH